MYAFLFFIIVPLIISNVLHMVVVKKNWFAFFTVPVSQSLFGKNKTWRGFIIVPVLNGLMLLTACLIQPFLLPADAFLTGYILGFAYTLFELPNSFLKRRLGIAPGGEAQKYRLFFMLLDKTDSSFGVSLASYFLLELSLTHTLLLFGISILTHIFFSWILVLVRVKKSF